MASKTTTKQKIPRAQDPNFVRNPYSGHFIRRGGKKHRQMLTDGMLGKKRDPSSIIATGSRAELEMMKGKLDNSPAIDMEGCVLTIRGDQLIKEHKKMTKREIVEHTTRHAVDSAVSNRALMRSNLSDDQLSELLNKVCNAKIVGVDLDLDLEFNRIMELNHRAPSPTPAPSPVERSELQSPLPSPPPSPLKMSRAISTQVRRTRPPRRFKVMAAPVYDTTTDAGDTTVCYDTDDGYSE